MPSRSIPRIIHQISLGGHLRPELQKNIDVLRHRNERWEHRLYTDAIAEDFIQQHYGASVLSQYRRINPRYLAARSDLLRQLILFKSGGVYCDLTTMFERPLGQVIRNDDRYLLAQWHNGPGEPNERWGLHRDLAHIPGGEYMTHFIICEPGHGYTAAVIERILQNIDQYRPWTAVGRTGVLRTTGPIAYTLAIWPIRDQHPHRIVTPEELGVRYWIGKDFTPAGQRKHYSRSGAPVVELGPAERAMSRVFVAARLIKSAMGLGWRPGADQSHSGIA